MLLSAFLLSGLTANWYFCGLGCQQSTSVYYQCRFVDVSDNHQNPQSSYTNDGVTCEVSVDDWLCITESVAQMCSESNMNGTTCYYTFYEYPKTSVKIVKGPEKVNIPTDIFKVECQDSKRTEKKESISARIFQRSSLQDSNIISKTKTSNNALNVSVLAWDLGSMSSLEFSRLMPITSQYLETDLRAFTFQKYNSLDMTSVNSLFPILTGKTDKEWIDSRGQPLEKILDDLPFVWKTFAEHGYITAFADDTVLWTDKRVGQPEGLSFLEKPTHHYLGPLYSEMANDISRWNPFCLAGMATHKVHFLLRHNKMELETPY